MGKDPAFLFYPGDYLRDTHMLNSATHVAYDKIMCEHMRNICISERQLARIAKDLSEEEKEDLILILTRVEKGFIIDWVAESIKREGNIVNLVEGIGKARITLLKRMFQHHMMIIWKMKMKIKMILVVFLHFMIFGIYMTRREGISQLLKRNGILYQKMNMEK